MFKSWKGYRTIIWNVATGLTMAAPEIINLMSVHDWIPPRFLLYIGILNIAGNIYLRTQTDSAVGEKE